MEIKVDDLRGEAVVQLLTEHLRCMAEVSPPGGCHALNLDGLRRPDITFWSAWRDDQLVGCGALRELDPTHGEIKSMRTATHQLRSGVASRMLRHIIQEARKRGYQKLSLETGGGQYFEPARRMYQKFGFQECSAFGGYNNQGSSVFMTLDLPSDSDGQFVASTDIAKLDFDLIHSFLSGSYWAKGIPREVVERSIRNSLVFGIYDGERQVAFARVITDRATFAYIGDVFVIPECRGRGVSKLLMREIVNHPELQGLRRMLLATKDAHGLYAQFGFEALKRPEDFMQIHHPDPYRAEV